jgi:HNH endonuclease
VWRNYARVFGCSLLATKADKFLFVSDICRNLANGQIRDVDEYLTNLIQKFRFPSPVFESYEPKEPISYPFVAVLKYLLAVSEKEILPAISIDEIFSIIIGNGCSGLESPEFYSQIRSTNHVPSGDQARQIREMMLVLSQFSFLKWSGKKLYFDISFDLKGFLGKLELSKSIPNDDRFLEFKEMTTHGNVSTPVILMEEKMNIPMDLVFTEGKRTRITHLKIERSPLLRKIFFTKYPQIICNMCELRPRTRYPWSDNLLEIHHLLPLSSGIAFSSSGTSLGDIVPLCPNCHRSIHSYYKIWLDGNAVNDFSSKSEAILVYQEAKKKLIL